MVERWLGGGWAVVGRWLVEGESVGGVTVVLAGRDMSRQRHRPHRYGSGSGGWRCTYDDEQHGGVGVLVGVSRLVPEAPDFSDTTTKPRKRTPISTISDVTVTTRNGAVVTALVNASVETWVKSKSLYRLTTVASTKTAATGYRTGSTVSSSTAHPLVAKMKPMMARPAQPGLERCNGHNDIRIASTNPHRPSMGAKQSVAHGACWVGRRLRNAGNGPKIYEKVTAHGGHDVEGLATDVALQRDHEMDGAVPGGVGRMHGRVP